ncbi:cyclic nucleotide-gated ion channel 1-like [Pyrus communis]|uniref:cyclic nucleotide-gated ion channel 1-like n=1 Tax=Pyrus communis TaxID=23211 RepID=UPI0035C10889
MAGSGGEELDGKNGELGGGELELENGYFEGVGFEGGEGGDGDVAELSAAKKVPAAEMADLGEEEDDDRSTVDLEMWVLVEERMRVLNSWCMRRKESRRSRRPWEGEEVVGGGGEVEEAIGHGSSPRDEILKLAKRSKESMLDSTLTIFAATFGCGRMSYKRDGGDGSKWSADLVAITLQILYPIIVMVYIGPMLVDPLFLYVPIINENIKCLALDEKLKKTVIVLRSFTDLPYVCETIYQVLPVLHALICTDGNSCRWREAGRLFRPEFLLQSILPVLPIPQIVILIFLPKMTGSRSLNGMKFLNSLILLQYVARAYPIFKFCKNYNKSTRELSNNIAMRKKIWIPGLLNFIMYILASHVLGAFWYFFSIQREIDCWISTCRSENGCDLSTLQCDNTRFRNITLLHDLCPTNPPNPVVFDFGIFLNTLQSGIVGTTDFSQKFLMCFSWGLRNLSSFASNLNTSTYAWENVFVIFISMSGLVLFIYLLGHLQTFMQATTRTYRIRLRKEVISQQIRFMLSEYGIPDKLPNAKSPESVAKAIWELVREALEKDEDLPVKNIFSLLPGELKEHIKRHLFLDTLKKMPGLENKNREVLEEIMKHLEPVNYADGSYIIREGEPLDRMLFITQGSVLTYKTSTIGGGSGSSSIIRRDFYGEELIGWAEASNSLSDFPISAKTVKSRTEVEVFVLMANDLQLVVSKFRTQSNTEIPQPADSAPVEISIS